MTLVLVLAVKKQRTVYSYAATKIKIKKKAMTLNWKSALVHNHSSMLDIIQQR